MCFNELISKFKEKRGLSIFDIDFEWTVITWWNGRQPPLRYTKWKKHIKCLFSEDVDHALPFVGGVVGWLGYEAGKHFEQMPVPKSKVNFPEVYFWETDGGILLHHKTNTMYLAGTDNFINQAQQLLTQPNQSIPITGCKIALPCKKTQDHYQQSVRYLLNKIREGELYQANLSWKMPDFKMTTPLGHWLKLRKHNHSRYGAYLQMEGINILSNSPERYLHINRDDRNILVQSTPIKGTSTQGAKNRLRLWNSEKERAELTMITDLVRNDFGRVCEPGSIFPGHRRIKKCGDLYHAEQTVYGRISADRNCLDILSASFPPGSVTGAPKVSAMKFIHHLETEPRGIYTGTIGFISKHGRAHFNVAIRTITVQDACASYRVGAGIVADSCPKQEWKETLSKGRAILFNLSTDK